VKKEEYKKRLKSIGNRDDLIPGIYNYCDRWCERCQFTSKCANFELSGGFNESSDLDNEAFWDELKIIFEVTLEMISEHAEQMGIDLSQIETEQEDEKLPENELTELSKEYGLKVHKWINENKQLFEQKAHDLLMVNEEKVIQLNDALEVINWYSIFISAKIHRAFLDLGMDDFFDDDDEEYINDNLGSAKIAVIAIDRSIAAFGYLLNQLSEFEDDILNFLASLSKVKQGMLNAFPNVMEFKRPGFDD
jgi:hypothetical protein